jgi:two-component system sensor histidine kinase/response regulator
MTERRVYESSDADSAEKSEKKNKKSIQEELEEKVYLSVSVSDTGVGMNEEMRRKCFTLFGNLKFKKDVNQGGIGLGLASSSLICKAL